MIICEAEIVRSVLFKAPNLESIVVYAGTYPDAIGAYVAPLALGIGAYQWRSIRFQLGPCGRGLSVAPSLLWVEVYSRAIGGYDRGLSQR